MSHGTVNVASGKETQTLNDKVTEQTRTVELDPSPKAKLSSIGGSDRDEWNGRLANLVVNAVPNSSDEKQKDELASAVISGLVDMKPEDPIEGVLIGQIIAANEAAMGSYRRAWAQPPEYFDARLKYFAVADKAARTVALLTERLDRHRTQGQQQIVVKHITVNAEQAVVTDTVVTGSSGDNPLAAGKLISAECDNSLRMPDPVEPELVPVGRGQESK